MHYLAIVYLGVVNYFFILQVWWMVDLQVESTALVKVSEHNDEVRCHAQVNVGEAHAGVFVIWPGAGIYLYEVIMLAFGSYCNNDRPNTSNTCQKED